MDVQFPRKCRALLLASLIGLSFSAFGAEVTGAGSTFVYPVLSRWADSYKKETGASINYQSIGSGGGIKMISNKTVDFGATDKPLKPEDLEKAGLVQFPIISGAVVPVVNLEGVTPGQLKLTGSVLADIYLGKITKWNDPAITTLNKDIKIPNKMISVVHRSDGSGTTFIWTNYLSKISPEWKTKVGEDSAVQWPTGVGAKGNEGIASNVQQIAGSIGYVEYAYAHQNKMTYAQLKNSAGQFVSPNEESSAAAVAGADWSKAKDYYLILTDAPGKKSWPVAGTTFILMQKNHEKPEQAVAALKFFSWAYKNGTASAKELHYVPIPPTVAKLIEKTWKENIKTQNGSPIAVGL